MNRVDTKLDGPVLIESSVHGDSRGFFAETFRANVFRELGVHDEWVQDNHSRSRLGVLRGMHFQRGMAKLVRCVRGSIVDVLVDVREGSPAFGQWEAFELDDQNGRQLYAPEGFAHGFCVTSDLADVTYKCSAYYDPDLEGGFRYDDAEVGIEWPDLQLQVSERDKAAPPLAELRELPLSYSAG
jgi:dTDP-4-dehydrorhamnose 3,5-epimerase